MNDYKPLIGRRILVTTELMTFDGTLAHVGRSTIELTHVAAVADDGGRQPVDGIALIPAERVLWVQVP